MQGAEGAAQGPSRAAAPIPDAVIKVAKYVPRYGSEPGNKTLPVLDAFPGSPRDLGELLPLPLPQFPRIRRVPPRIRAGWGHGAPACPGNRWVLARHPPLKEAGRQLVLRKTLVIFKKAAGFQLKTGMGRGVI